MRRKHRVTTRAVVAIAHDKRRRALQRIRKGDLDKVMLDACVLIHSRKRDRHGLHPDFGFETFKEIWLEPLLSAFNCHVHEAVVEEVTTQEEADFIKEKKAKQRLRIVSDSTLQGHVTSLRDTIENTLSRFTKYDPSLVLNGHRVNDKGEVKSLSHLAATGEDIAFLTKDTEAINLIENAAEWETGLDNVMLLEDKDVLYHFKKEGIVAEVDLCRYYEYLHHNVQKEREDNPPWNEFLEAMDNLYG